MKHFIIITLLITLKFSFGQDTPQNIAENAIMKHIEKTFSTQEYHGYEFGDLFKITPAEITEIEKLKNKSKLIDTKNDSLVNYYNSLIKEKTKEVKAKKLYSTYEINHFFTLKEKYKNPILQEYNFVLFPDGKIKDVNKELEFKLSADEYNYYYYYYKRKDLYNNKEQNEKIYAYIENLYKSERINKEAAMSTLLTVSKVIYEYNVYDTVLIARIEAQKWLTKNTEGTLTINKYSSINAIIDTITKDILGYNIFAKVLQNDSIKAFYFEFDYDYILRGVLPIETPFEQYFKTQDEATKKE
jgi:hypothetical protein